MEARAIVTGLVQGVCFRATVCQHAEELHLTGRVKNLPDQTVQIIIQGDEPILAQFFTNLRANPGHAQIDQIQLTYHPPSTAYTDFQIDLC